MRNNFTALCIRYGVLDHLHHSLRRLSIGYACFYMPAHSGTVGANISSQPRLRQKSNSIPDRASAYVPNQGSGHPLMSSCLVELGVAWYRKGHFIEPQSKVHSTPMAS